MILILILVLCWLYFTPWLQGRSKGNYFKKLLLDFTLFDLVIIKIPKDGYVGEHRDPCQGYKHLRFNWVFGRFIGGKHFIEGTRQDKRYLFRPDKLTHWVTPITTGTQYIFSIGVRLKDAKPKETPALTAKAYAKQLYRKIQVYPEYQLGKDINFKCHIPIQTHNYCVKNKIPARYVGDGVWSVHATVEGVLEREKER